LTVTSEAEPRAGESGGTADTGLAITVKGLGRRYGEREALRGVDVALAQGQTVAVFGPNGAGKTTLLRVLGTLLLPHAGTVRVLGHDLPRNAHAVRAKIGFLGHETLLYRELTGRENLIFYARLYRVPDPEERIRTLLEAAAMTARADEPVHSLSRGMVQRLAICRAVLHEPELLLLDEPFAGLDPDAEELVEPLIGRSCPCSRVLVTHDIERGLTQADHVLGLRDGQVLLRNAARECNASDVRALYGHRKEAPR
jgi:ABC-type multidrug transport system ATPase subunit